MRIAYITAGAAGMYCGSCLHDNTLAAALLELGEDVLLVPTYTPLRTDEPNVSIDRVFFGGINVYLQEKLPLFRHTPWWFDRLLDQPGPARASVAAGRQRRSDAAGRLTVSMLRGEAGHQRKEIEKLVHWLLTRVRPDVVHLSNSMLIGMARMIRERGGPPVVCQLSGEDLFLEKLPPPYYDRGPAHLRERAADVDAFVAINRYYADFMADYLAVDRDRVHVIPHGLKLDGHGQRGSRSAARRAARRRLPGPRSATTRDCISWSKPASCWRRVSMCRRSSCARPAISGEGDRPYLDDSSRQIAAGPLAGRFEYLGELDRQQKIAFLQSLDVFSMPTVYRESKGLPALEALANAVPVVLPDHGSFSEMVADTGGGLLHRPHDAADLAEKCWPNYYAIRCG